MRQYIGIIRDHSGSMSRLTNQAMDDFNALVQEMRESFDLHSTIVTVVECGVGSRFSGFGAVEVPIPAQKLGNLLNISRYTANGSSTPLFDSVGKLITQLESNKRNDDMLYGIDNDYAFLVIAITDGEENASRLWYASNLKTEINRKQASDRWTFTFRVPRGYKNNLVNKLGIHEGNVVEWEVSEQGMQYSTAQTKSGIQSYSTMRSSGATSTDKFYVDVAAINKAVVQRNLIDISNAVTILTTGSVVEEIKPFFERVSRKFYTIGTCYYQLTKTETLQVSKRIIVRDNLTGKTYAGTDARHILGLPDNREVKIVPKNFGNYTVFVQSTSVNRKLMPNTQVVFYA